MREVLDQLEGLIQFQGLNFRSTKLDCKQCGWSGTGGSLEVPDLAASGEPVIYACPACMEPVAVHNGLTDQEVMCEMEKIREVLAAELVGVSGPGQHKPAVHHPRPDFAAIRSQLPTAQQRAAEIATAEANAHAQAEAVKDEDLLDQVAEASRRGPDLDFAAIRARLSVPV